MAIKHTALSSFSFGHKNLILECQFRSIHCKMADKYLEDLLTVTRSAYAVTIYKSQGVTLDI
jgi:hypothetical protein